MVGGRIALTLAMVLAVAGLYLGWFQPTSIDNLGTTVPCRALDREGFGPHVEVGDAERTARDLCAALNEDHQRADIALLGSALAVGLSGAVLYSRGRTALDGAT